MGEVSGVRLEHYLCFDVGGTSVKSGLLTERGKLLKIRTDPAPVDAVALLELMERRAGEFASDAPRGIGVATTGLVDPWKGMILPRSEPISGYGGTLLRAELERRTGLPAEIENDVNCALLGESWLGAARGFRNVVCITAGTGIGGALMIDGWLYRGSRFRAMEVGHIPFPPESREEHCPKWEDIASTRAFVRKYAKLSGESFASLDGRLVMERAREGEETALRAVDDLCFYLAQGIATLFCTLAPDLFIFGGGIAGSLDLLYPRIDAYLDRALDVRFREGIVFKAAELGNRAGLVGALKHFLDMIPIREKKPEREREAT